MLCMDGLSSESMYIGTAVATTISTTTCHGPWTIAQVDTEARSICARGFKFVILTDAMFVQCTELKKRRCNPYKY